MKRSWLILAIAAALAGAAVFAMWRWEARLVVVRPVPALPEGAIVLVRGQPDMPLFADTYVQCEQAEKEADDLFCMNNLAVLLTEQDVVVRLPYLLRWLNRDPDTWPPPRREVDYD